MADEADPRPDASRAASGGGQPASPRRAASLARIFGRVQGVGYRYWTRTQAVSLSLTGYVRNLTDGSVEALFIGDPQDVARMLTYCEEGPPTAKVTRVEASSPPPELSLDYPRFRRAPTRPPGAPV